MKRRKFFGSLAGLIAAPVAAKALPKQEEMEFVVEKRAIDDEPCTVCHGECICHACTMIM